MMWVGTTETALLVALALVLLWLVWVFGRRRWLGRQGGTFDCSARLVSGGRSAWVLGVARYSGDWLEWHRVFGFSLAPRLRFHRSRTELGAQRVPSSGESLSLYEGQRIVQLVPADGEPVEVALGSQELTGLLSWLEGAPPGRGRYDNQVR